MFLFPSVTDLSVFVGGAGGGGGLQHTGSIYSAQGNAMHSLLVHDKGESLLLNLLLPLCLKIGSGRKDSPKMRKNDIKFSMNLLLNLLNPSRTMPGIL